MTGFALENVWGMDPHKAGPVLKALQSTRRPRIVKRGTNSYALLL